MSVIAALAGVHRTDEDERAGVSDRSAYAGDVYDAFFQRLTQHLADRAVKLGQFIKEQNAVVRQRNLARPRIFAAAAMLAQDSV